LLAAERNCAHDDARGALCAIVEAIRRDLTTARCFQVPYNQLASLPPELGLLTNLKQLSVRQSRQMDLDLTALSRCQVGANQLTSLPAEIGQLTRLEWLSVRNSN
jgi:Leucine-rich repeat (LRR) protein